MQIYKYFFQYTNICLKNSCEGHSTVKLSIPPPQKKQITGGNPPVICILNQTIHIQRFGVTYGVKGKAEF